MLGDQLHGGRTFRARKVQAALKDFPLTPGQALGPLRAQPLLGRIGRGDPPERMVPREELVQQNPQAVDVSRSGDRFTTDLFG